MARERRSGYVVAMKVREEAEGETSEGQGVGNEVQEGEVQNGAT